MDLSLADLGGGARDARPLSVQFFFIFMQFSGKFIKIIGWRPHLWGWRPPPLGNPASATVCGVAITFKIIMFIKVVIRMMWEADILDLDSLWQFHSDNK